MLVRKRGKIPIILSFGKIKVTIQTIPIFITKPKRPKVKILRGRVIILKIGLMKKLITPKTKPAKTKTPQESANSTLGINLIANQKPRIPAKICEISRFIISTISNISLRVNLQAPFFLIFYDKLSQIGELHRVVVKLN